jgi:hypothetical protein
MKKMISLIVVALMVVAAASIGLADDLAPRLIKSGGKEYRWWRGQPHFHVNWVAIDNMVRWYRYQNYNWVAPNELNRCEPVAGVKAMFDLPGYFITLPGTELSSAPKGGVYIDTSSIGGNMEKAQAEWNAKRLGYLDMTKPPLFVKTSAADVLNEHARIIRKHGGVPYASHPNFGWPYDHKDLLKTDPNLVRHFEVRNGEHGMNDLGGGGKPSTEEIWDNVLSTGRLIYGWAVDDSHHLPDMLVQGQQDFFNQGKRWKQARALAGRTSMYVRANELTEEALLTAIEKGDFYSVLHLVNLPIVFESYDVDENGISLTLPKQDLDKGNNPPGENSIVYKTYFIGKNGKVLKVDESYNPSYKFTGDELYVRVRVQDSDGGIALTQPVFVKKR